MCLLTEGTETPLQIGWLYIQNPLNSKQLIKVAAYMNYDITEPLPNPKWFDEVMKRRVEE